MKINNKKILFCDNTLWGLITFRGAVIRKLVELGYNITLVAPYKEDKQLQIKIPQGVKFISIKMGRTSQNPFNDFCYFLKILKIYKEEKPDYIFHYTIKPNIYGTIAATLLKIPNTAMLAGLGYIFQNDTLGCKIGRKIYRFGLAFCDHLFVLNQMNKELVIKRKMCSPEKIILLENGEGVDLKKYKYEDNTAEETTFLFIGRILKDKGYNEFVEAAKIIKEQFPNTHFEILGALDPQYPNSISPEKFKKDQELGIFKYLGFTNDMQSVYKRKGIVITLPSYGEGMNRVLMEACATGKPIITTNIPGCKEMVSEGANGYLAKVKDAHSLIEAMRKYLELTKEQKNNFSKKSREIAEEKFDIKKIFLKYEDIISSNI